MSAALKRLSEAPAPPQAIEPSVSASWEAAILHALARDPANRPFSAEQVVAILAGDDVAATLPVRVPTKRTAWMLAPALATLLIAGGVIGYTVRRPKLGVLAPAPKPSVRPRRSVAVLGFRNLSGKPDQLNLATALSEMTTSEVAAGGQLRAIPGETVARAKISLALPDTDSFGTETLRKIHRNLGCDDIIVGDYLATNSGRLRVDLNLEDATTGELMDAVTVNGDADQIADLVSQAGASLRAKLGAPDVSPTEAAQVRATLPQNPEAETVYAEGLEKLRHYDPVGARDLLQKATAAEPDFALAHVALASALSQLDNDREAAAESAKAASLTAGLSREDQLRVQANADEAAGGWNQAAGVYRTLWDFFPDDVGYGEQLVRAQLQGGQGQEAIATLEALRKFPSEQSEDPQIDMLEAYVAESLGDFHREQQAAARAKEVAERNGSLLAVAAACMPEGWALLSTGYAAQSVPLFQQAKDIYTAAGDRPEENNALGNIAHALQLQGDLAGALIADQQVIAFYRSIGSKRSLAIALGNTALVLGQLGNIPAARNAREESLGIDKEIGNKHGVQTQLNGLAILSKQQGHLDEAQREYEDSLAISREIGDKQGMGITIGNLGNIFLARGMLQKAKPMYEQALELRTSIGDKHGISVEANALGNAYVQEGNLSKAEELINQALSVGREIKENNQIAFALEALGDLKMEQADFASARQNYTNALSIRKEMQSQEQVIATRSSLADIHVEEQHVDEAIDTLQSLVLESSKQQNPEVRVAVSTSLANALVEAGRPADASRALSEVQNLLPQVQGFEICRFFEIARARAEAGLNKAGPAIAALQSVLKEAKTKGLVPLQLEARLRLDQIEIASRQNVPLAKADLAALKIEASTKGFLRIARKTP